MDKKVFRAAAMLIGTMVGAGIFGIPYTISRVGFGVGLIYLLGLGSIILILNLAHGQVVLSTNGKHQSSGYALKYLGRGGRILALTSIFFGFYGALVAYIIKVGEFLGVLLPFLGSETWSLVFFSAMAGLILLGLNILSRFESLLSLLLIGAILALSLFGLPYLRFDNLTHFDPNFIFLPYGVILFALGGASIIPEMGGVFEKTERFKLKRAIILGTLIPIMLYLFFSLMVVGVTGLKTSDDAIRGLESFHPFISHLGAIVGTITMSSSFLMLGTVLKDLYLYDFKFPPLLAWGMACFPPLVIFLLGLHEFILVLGIAGALMGGFEGMVIILNYFALPKKAEKEPEYQIRIPRWLGWLLISVFALGIVYEIFSTFFN